MGRDRCPPSPFVEGKTTCEKQDQRADAEPNVAGDELPQEYSPERYGIRRELVLQCELAREKQCEQGPDRPNSNPFDEFPVPYRQVFHEQYFYHHASRFTNLDVTNGR
jgi:hypothetical protein